MEARVFNAMIEGQVPSTGESRLVPASTSISPYKPRLLVHDNLFFPPKLESFRFYGTIYTLLGVQQGVFVEFRYLDDIPKIIYRASQHRLPEVVVHEPPSTLSAVLQELEKRAIVTRDGRVYVNDTAGWDRQYLLHVGQVLAAKAKKMLRQGIIERKVAESVRA